MSCLTRMNAVPLLSLCLCVSSASYAQTTTSPAPDMKVTRHVPATTVLTHPTERIPFNLQQNRIIVEATINGAGPFPFILDTCAGTFLLDAALAAELALPVIGEATMGDPVDPDAVTVEVVELDRVTLGGATFSGLTANLWEGGGYGHGDNPPRGVMSFPMFRNTLLTIDWAASELVVTDDALPPANGDDVLDMLMDGGVPMLEFDIAGHPLHAHLDTGAPMAIGIPDRFEPVLHWSETPRVVAHARTVNGTFAMKEGTLKGDVRFGGHRLENPVLMTNDRFAEANVGVGFLRHFRLSFDQRNPRRQMTRQGDEPIDLSMRSQSHRH